MSRISTERDADNDYKPKIEIEHYLDRDHNPTQQLVWRNMLGVCNGNSGTKPHCDKAKENLPLARLNPLSRQNSEALLAYSLSGEIKTITTNPKAKNDLDVCLNLNDEKLVQFRKDKIDTAKEFLTKKYPNRQWDERVFDREIESWSSRENDRFKPWFKATVWFLEWMKQRPKYK